MIGKKQIDDKKVHPIGVGTWTIGGDMATRKGGEEDAAEAIRYSISKGQNHIDTAEMYGDGHSEEIVGMAIEGADRDKLFIASKVWKNYTKASEVTAAVEGMLERLGTDYLDMVYIHSPNLAGSIKDYVEGLNKAVERGLTRGLAISNFNVEQTQEAEAHAKSPILANQIVYNILLRHDATPELLKYSEEKNIRIVAYRPVERGLLADDCENEAVLAVAEKYGKTPAQVAINWLIVQENVLTIPKSTNKEHIDENLEAADFEMEKEDIERLNRA